MIVSKEAGESIFRLRFTRPGGFQFESLIGGHNHLICILLCSVIDLIFISTVLPSN